MSRYRQTSAAWLCRIEHLLPKRKAGLIRLWALTFCASLVLAACGGGQSSDVASASETTDTAVDVQADTDAQANAADTRAPLVTPVVTATASQSEPEVAAPVAPSSRSALNTAAAAVATQALTLPAADPGLLLLLVPDGFDPANPGVAAWLDAAAEEGVRIRAVSDAQFLALGASAQGFAGLILPDSLHALATDEIVAAVTDYTQAGGKTMLVFDFGALTLLNGVPVYPVPKSRLSALAGVDYVMYESLREKTTGLGPVTALRSTMRSLLVPPGKSLPFTGLTPVDPAGVLGDVSRSAVAANGGSAQGSPLLDAASISTQSALYLPVSPADPGGVRGFDPQQYGEMRYASSTVPKGRAREVKFNLGRAFKAKPLGSTSQAITLSSVDASSNTPARAAVTADPLEAYHGYLLGNLIYPSYVTQGNFGELTGQKVVATSPQFGLVAGVNPVGAGQVLFVNLPLTYLKGRTDGLMLHGFLHYFARNVLGMAHLSSMPNGVAGMTLDWHLDSKAAQAPTANLIKLNVFNNPKALFSMEMTAGPDAIVANDGLGWNLPSNATAKNFLRTFQTAGHSVGAHGGWNHDFYGGSASETNALLSTGGACVNTVANVDNFLQCLVLNRQSVDGVTGKASRSYSAPEGNNPLWAMDWLESKGVVATYYGGHTGLGATRQYRDGQLRNPSIWVFPVTPQGLFATYEEFQEYNVPKSDVMAWYHDLIDFSVAQNTSRLVYAHPPGAYQWRTVLTDMLAYAKNQGAKFSWYTMPRVADFMTRRMAVNWSQSLNATNGKTVFTVTHPQGLQEMVWRLPKSRYVTKPVIVSGVATVVGTDAQYWLVKAGAGTSLVFRS